MHLLFNFLLPFPWQPRFSIFSIFQQYIELKITVFWTALPKKQCGKCMCLCFHTINMTKFFTLVLILLLFVSMVTRDMVVFICYYVFFNALKIGNFQNLFSKNLIISLSFLVISELVNCYLYFTILKNWDR